jgi:hypothetical protein
MKKLLLPIMALLVAVLVFQACKDDKKDDPQVHVPVITDFTPKSGPTGTSVTITGSFFSKEVSKNAVSFGGASAAITSATETQLVVTVPANAASGKISVTVNGNTVTSTSDFTVEAPASTITSFEPATAIAGATVIIKGTNFNTTPAMNIVKFNGVQATVTAATATQLTVTVPQGSGNGKITVGAATSATDFTVLLPTITGFAPLTGFTGTVVTITGTNFSTTFTNNIVKFNGVQATVTEATSLQLKVTVPAGVTPGKITVNTVSSLTDFEAFGISNFTPASRAIGGQVVINGAGFSATAGNNEVQFNGVVANIISATATQLTVEVPYGATDGKVKVTTGAISADASTDFNVVSAWTKKTDYPGGTREKVVTFTIGNKGYFGGSYGNGGYHYDFYEYDPTIGAGGTWTQKADIPADVYFSGFSVGDLGYVKVNGSNEVYEYNPTADQWTNKGVSPITDVEPTEVFLGNLEYVKDEDGKFYTYDPTLPINNWTPLLNYPEGASFWQDGFAINGKIYVGGGLSGAVNVASSHFYEYNPATNDYIQKSDLPTVNGGPWTAFSIGQYGYLRQDDNFWRYDSNSNTWTQLENVLDFGSVVPCTVIGQKAYFSTGKLNGNDQKETWEYDPAK